MSLRRANRQIEVFDISLMAVVTKAMGAFLVMMLLLLPYYTGVPPTITSPEQARKAVAEASRQVGEAAQNAGREDAEKLRRQLEAAQKALQKADNAIREMKTQLDQLWSQYTRMQRELAETQQQVAKMRDQLAQTQRQLAQAQQQAKKDRQTIAALQARLRELEAQRPTKPLMAMLHVAPWPPCAVGLIPDTDFVPAGRAPSGQGGGSDFMGLPWVLSKAVATSDVLLDRIQQTLLYLPAEPGINYVAVTTDKPPTSGCLVVGQLLAVLDRPPDEKGRVRTEIKALPLHQDILNTGPILLATIDSTGKDLVIRKPTKADLDAWTKVEGGQVPTQPPPESQSGASPGKPAHSLTPEQQAEFRKLFKQDPRKAQQYIDQLLHGSASGPGPLDTPASPARAFDNGPPVYHPPASSPGTKK